MMKKPIGFAIPHDKETIAVLQKFTGVSEKSIPYFESKKMPAESDCTCGVGKDKPYSEHRRGCKCNKVIQHLGFRSPDNQEKFYPVFMFQVVPA